MLVSTHMRVSTETNARVQSRKSSIDEDDTRRVFERPDDSRRQGASARRQRPNARPRDLESETPSPAPARVATPRRDVASKPAAFSTLSRAAEFWSLLGAVAADNAESALPAVPPPAVREPSLQELLARAVASD